MTAALATLLFGAAPVYAQDRLFIGTGEIGALGRFGERIGSAPEAVYGQLVAGGRYVSAPAGAYDTSTGAFVPAQGGVVIAVDPRRSRLFMHDRAVVSVFDLESHVSTPLMSSTGFGLIESVPALAQLAADANQLFVWHRVAGVKEIAVVDLATGTVSRRFPISTFLGSFTDWRVAADGARLLVADAVSIRLLDATTGQALASHPLASGRIVDDRLNRRIYVIEFAFARLHVFDDALGVIGEVGLRAACGASAVFSPHTGRLYLVESTSEGTSLKEGFTHRYFLSAFDAASGGRIDSREITRAAGIEEPNSPCDTLPIAVVTAPGAPQSLTATASGRNVTLSWTNVGDATNFVLDVGLASGRSDLTFSVGATSPVTLANAPPGTYYLRVRGTNAFGVSRASYEVVLAVP